MQDVTPYLLAVVAVLQGLASFFSRRATKKSEALDSKLTGMHDALTKLDGMPQTIKNLESLVKDELRHFDVRITRLEAKSELRP